MRFSFTDESTQAASPCPYNTFVAYMKAVHIELKFKAKFSVDSAMDNLSHFPSVPMCGCSRERWWGARELQMGSGVCRTAVGDKASQGNSTSSKKGWNEMGQKSTEKG